MTDGADGREHADAPDDRVYYVISDLHIGGDEQLEIGRASCRERVYTKV